MPHIQESHPEPDERTIMPKFNSKAENVVHEFLSGEYPFEIMAVDNAISQGNKTRGSDTREVKLKFFKDATFAVPVAQWTETFIYHETTEWKCELFAKCVGFTDPAQDGTEFDIDGSWVGRRGWAKCQPETPREELSKPVNERKKYNRVQIFIANHAQALSPNPNAAKPAEEDDDMPF